MLLEKSPEEEGEVTQKSVASQAGDCYNRPHVFFVKLHQNRKQEVICHARD
jgi:hypothetical protein